MDVEDIAPGQNFAQTIDRTIASCSAVLAVIGPRWMEILRKRSQESQRDFVCHEIEAALAHNITVIPVLVGGATMAQLTGITGPIADLPLHQAAELRDGAFKEDCTRLVNALRAHPGLKSAHAENRAGRKKLWLYVGAAVALIALLVALSSAMGIGPWSEYRARQTKVHQLLATVRTQIDQAQYESAFRTSHDVLAIDAGNRAATDLQEDAAMLWLRNFHVLIPEGRKAQDLAGPPLAEIMSVLEAGLARTNSRGLRAADLLAHLGWAHWLNEHIAEKEFGAAERGLRQALSIDPGNVYANAMLGDWLLQTHGSLDEALRHFDVAFNTRKERSFVRRMQVGGMIYNFEPGVRRALAQVANQMRINSEPIDERDKGRILSNYSTTVNSEDELRETLSAVAPNDSWATFLWLEGQPARGSDSDRMRREFIHASILELDGKSSEALAMFKKLEREMKAHDYTGRLADHIAAAIKRFSR